jgi:hypothetical protein
VAAHFPRRVELNRAVGFDGTRPLDEAGSAAVGITGISGFAPGEARQGQNS